MEDNFSIDQGGGDSFGMIRQGIAFELTSCCVAQLGIGVNPWRRCGGPLLYPVVDRLDSGCFRSAKAEWRDELKHGLPSSLCHQLTL